MGQKHKQSDDQTSIYKYRLLYLEVSVLEMMIIACRNALLHTNYKQYVLNTNCLSVMFLQLVY